MSRRDKTLQRFLTKPADFKFNEMNNLLRGFGYKKVRTGKTAGSRVAFMNKANGHIIRIHKPHPGNILKRYQLGFLEEELKAKGVLE